MVSLIISIVSLLLSVAAVLIAWSSFCQARQVEKRAQKEWKQRKWFDLYFKADEAYDALDHFRVQYLNSLSLKQESVEWGMDWNDLTRIMRTVNRMALVFPKNPAIDALFASTAAFSNPTEALSEGRLKQLSDACEELRKRALVDASVL